MTQELKTNQNYQHETGKTVSGPTPLRTQEEKLSTQASTYFNEEIQMLSLSSPDEVTYIASSRDEFIKLVAKPDRFKGHPEDVSMALGKVAGDMGVCNPNIPANVSEDPLDEERNAAVKKRYMVAKRIFMQGCAGIFDSPDSITNDVILEKTDDLRTRGIYRSEDLDNQLDKIKSIISKGEEMKSSPIEFLKSIDKIQYEISRIMENIAREEVYGKEDHPGTDTCRKVLAKSAEMVYQLQIVRNKFCKENYGGQEDLFISEVEKIEKVREKIIKNTEDGAEIQEKAVAKLKKSVGLEVQNLERNLGRSIQFYNVKIPDTDFSKWEKVSKELNRIRVEHFNDTSSKEIKNPKYEARIKELFDSLG